MILPIVFELNFCFQASHLKVALIGIDETWMQWIKIFTSTKSSWKKQFHMVGPFDKKISIKSILKIVENNFKNIILIILENIECRVLLKTLCKKELGWKSLNMVLFNLTTKWFKWKFPFFGWKI